ncbi:rho GTPase-activating protein 27-like [Pollicipes pollicipes]|uniref:rho GTPase-activating protein 27-like n=1 Tax=Pollicipes pollicipes TaxID=41117 RepID=UPI001885048C|nr:rho GTPase-activating protein 27-like [Pollicipes pollicipes]
MDRDLVVTVLFDFEYHGSDGERVYMCKDEEFLVIQQTNSDWWQVIRSGERKPFYAPTQYLRLQPHARPQLPPKVKRNARDSRRAPLSILDAERHIGGDDGADDDDNDEGGRRRCNSLEDAAAGSSSVETLDDSPPGQPRTEPLAEGEASMARHPAERAETPPPEDGDGACCRSRPR